MQSVGGSGGGKGEKFLDPAFMGKLDTLDLEQSWTDILNDPYVKSFPIEQSTKAFNDIVNILPMLRAPRYKTFLTALVKKQLAQGNSLDPAEVSNLSNMIMGLARGEQAYAQIETPNRARAMYQTRAAESASRDKGDKKSLADITGSAFPAAQLAGNTKSLLTSLMGGKADGDKAEGGRNARGPNPHGGAPATATTPANAPATAATIGTGSPRPTSPRPPYPPRPPSLPPVVPPAPKPPPPPIPPTPPPPPPFTPPTEAEVWGKFKDPTGFRGLVFGLGGGAIDQTAFLNRVNDLAQNVYAGKSDPILLAARDAAREVVDSSSFSGGLLNAAKAHIP